MLLIGTECPPFLQLQFQLFCWAERFSSLGDQPRSLCVVFNQDCSLWSTAAVYEINFHHAARTPLSSLASSHLPVHRSGAESAFSHMTGLVSVWMCTEGSHLDRFAAKRREKSISFCPGLPTSCCWYMQRETTHVWKTSLFQTIKTGTSKWVSLNKWVLHRLPTPLSCDWCYESTTWAVAAWNDWETIHVHQIYSDRFLFVIVSLFCFSKNGKKRFKLLLIMFYYKKNKQKKTLASQFNLLYFKAK